MDQGKRIIGNASKWLRITSASDINQLRSNIYASELKGESIEREESMPELLLLFQLKSGSGYPQNAHKIQPEDQILLPIAAKPRLIFIKQAQVLIFFLSFFPPYRKRNLLMRKISIKIERIRSSQEKSKRKYGGPKRLGHLTRHINPSAHLPEKHL